MKAPVYLFLGVLALLVSSPARAQFPVYPAADRVLGASDFATYSHPQATAISVSIYPRGLSIDPTSGKLFVVASSHHRILRYPDAASLSNGNEAEAVFGQDDFTSETSGTSSIKLYNPEGVYIDGSGRLWVADRFNSRVLMFQDASSATSGAAADLVLGQPNFTTRKGDNSAVGMLLPSGVFVDSADNLWVADTGLNRVLKFAAVSGLSNGAAATTVLGRPNFVSLPVYENISATKMYEPRGLTVDTSGRLWVADSGSNRVLRFDNAASLANGSPATAVLGQPNFSFEPSGCTAQKMSKPTALLVDPAGTLYVSDELNSRVLLFKAAANKPNGASADGVIGQPDFTSKEWSPVSDRDLRFPTQGLAMEGTGRLWVSDTLNSRVLRFPLKTTSVLLTATMSASLDYDFNINGSADASDKIEYNIAVSNPADANEDASTGTRFTLTPPPDALLEVGSVTTSQGTVTVGNTTGDGSIEIDLGTITDTDTVTVNFSLKLRYEAASPLLVQGKITSDLPGDLLTDDPKLAGTADATEMAVNFTFRPATFTLARVRPTKASSIRLSGTATAAVFVEVKRKPSGPVRQFQVLGTQWSGRISGLKTGSNRFTIRALGKDKVFIAPWNVTVRRLASPRRR